MLDVLFINDSNNYAGTDEFTKNIVNELKVKMDKKILIAVKPSRRKQLPYNELNTISILGGWVKPVSSLVRYYKVIRLLQLIMLPLSFLLLLADIVKWKLKKPAALVYINGGFPGSLYQCISFVIASHFFERVTFNLHNFATSGRMTKIMRFILKFSHKRALILTVSDCCARQLSSNIGRFVDYIHNGVKPAFIPVKEKESGINVVAMVCGLYKNKGVDCFIRLAEMSTRNSVVFNLYTSSLVGDNELVESVKSASKNLSNFNLIVGVTKKEEIYPNVDILLSLSSGFESFGLTIVEAMSHRVPVIVPSSMGPKEILDTCEGLNVGCVLNKIEVNEVLIAIDRVLSNKSLYTDGPIAVDKNFSLSKNTLKFLSKINRNI